MPLIRPGMRKPPPGFDVIQAKLEEYDEAMRLATQEDSKGVVGQTSRPRRTRDEKRKRQRDEGHEADDDNDDDDETHNGKADGAVARQAQGGPSAQAELTSSSSSSAVAAAAGGDDTSTPAEAAPVPPLWRMAAINRERTRYVFSAFAKQRTISKEVYDYCIDMQLIDGGLARRWRLPGYERLCCTACSVPGAASLAANLTSKYALRDKQERRLPATSAANAQASAEAKATCICRVPAAQRKSRHFLACAVCGCTGCCSADVAPAEQPSGEKKA